MSKDAKTAHKKKTEGHGGGDSAVADRIMLTGWGHRVSDSTSIQTDCGIPRIGWRFGTIDDVTCEKCRGGSDA